MEVSIQGVDQVEEAGETSESEVGTEIARLWTAQRYHAAAARRTREELKALRRSLSERLHEMKTLLVQVGRGGRWATFLRKRHIPRASADRYVMKWYFGKESSL